MEQSASKSTPNLLLAFSVVAGLGVVAWVLASGGGEPEPVVSEVVPVARAQDAETEDRAAKKPKSTAIDLKVKVHSSFPHDTKAFTQGLLFRDGKLFESTGLNGQSSIREVTLETGVVIRKKDLDAKYFAEGLTWMPETSQFVQLTWLKGKALVWNESLEQVGEHSYEGQGWGLCFDGESLVMSDGSSALSVRDPKTFAEIRRFEVLLDGKKQRNLNELECVKEGDAMFVYANVWQRDRIVKIDMRGKVVANIDASGLLTRAERRGTDVLNGIAHQPSSGHFFLTGKLWPKVFEVSFEAPSPTE